MVIHKRALACLLLQHSSSMFGAALYAFASYIFLVEIFTDTLAPASLVGIVTKVVGLTCSGYVGSLIDRTTRVRFTLEMINYGLFLGKLSP
ncbi:Ferroporti-1 [Papiliotrema laurentii]|uniref:Solute carrier family 40 member n=1 Tax=Papiliotrema laurentii TaxID=5418 RepID=A0AAD9L5W2_PAPLA|nr:Ferroporti-1 [Papiliotrema laurentii]